jgi:predicted ferric reductase
MNLWYATRAFGIVSLLMLSTVMVLGLLTAGRRAVPRKHRFVVAEVHRTVALTGVIFIALHVVTAIADGYVALSWLDVIVPFASSYNPLWTGLGTVAIDLLVALVATSLLRDRIGYRTWRAIHWAAYACYPIALAHGLGEGTDNTSPLLLVPAAVSVLAVGAAAVIRVRARTRGQTTRRAHVRQPVSAR